MFEIGKKYFTREGNQVEVFRIAEGEVWFPVKVRREDGTFYTVTREGKKMWNADNGEDILLNV